VLPVLWHVIGLRPLSRQEDYVLKDQPKDRCFVRFFFVAVISSCVPYNGKYQVIRRLGRGHISTVWLCWDLTQLFTGMLLVWC